jgi:recombination protein RecA
VKEQDVQAVQAAIDKLFAQAEKSFGKGAVQLLEGVQEGVKFQSTGSLNIDNCLGGGWAKGRIVEIYGGESSGKTTVAIETMVQAQKDSIKSVGFVDVEHAFDLTYAKALGLDVTKKRFVLSQPSSAEEAMSILEYTIESNAFSVVVLDSVAALTPKAEIEGEMGESKMGLIARLM